MVALSAIRASNALIATTFATPLVALFVGATSGIGEATLKAFARQTRCPKVYFVGRSQSAADRVVAECEALNPGGKYIFIRADVSLIKVVDQVCDEIKAKETRLDLLFLSQGVMSLDKKETSEHVHLLAALNYYSRIRFMTNLIPLLQNATSLRRIVNVGGGGMEGPIDAADFPGLTVPPERIRGHLCTLATLGIESVQKEAPTVSFVHNYPGTVYTGLYRDMKTPPFDPSLGVPIEECGERHLYLATSERYPAQEGHTMAVKVGDRVDAAMGSTGQVGGGVYSIGSDGEAASAEVRAMLAELRETGTVEDVQKHTMSEFIRIARS